MPAGPTARGAAGAAAVLALGVLTAGCESTQSQSARIAREGSQAMQASASLKVGRRNRAVTVRRAVVVTDEQSSAVAVELKVRGGRAQVNVPILISVRGRDGRQQYANDLVGLQPSLQRVAAVEPGQTVWWVNDQILGADHPDHVTAKVGGGASLATFPDVTIKDTDFHDDPDGTYLEGTLVNRTGRDLADVPVFAVGLKGADVVAAGRALVPKLRAESSRPTRFRIFFTGADPRGTELRVNVAPPAVPVSEATTP